MDSSKILPRQPARTGWRGLAFLTILFFISAMQLSASVLVAPTAVIMSKAKAGRLNIQNPTDKPVEVTINFSFGLPESDSLGVVKIELQDSAVTDPRSALGWIKAFPRKIVLEPNSSQIVRFRAKPPKDLADGEYWARVLIRSQEGQRSIPVPTDDDKITTKLNMIMQMAIILKYRTGNLVSKVEVLHAEAEPTDSSVIATIDMVNRGNVSYVGLLTCRLLDAGGQRISEDKIDLAVYHNLRRRVELPIVDAEFQEPYQVEITINTEGRVDIPPEDLIAGNSYAETIVVR
ncbi:MAG: molecular chaperone [Candidatus Zixiibacteriota bacterium]|nr:MAG: molecular chaperone [candidate division Zixibacteria bacterium]